LKDKDYEKDEDEESVDDIFMENESDTDKEEGSILDILFGAAN
jgi:hypothetical protein